MTQAQLPRGFHLWPESLAKAWLRQNRPKDYEGIFGKEHQVPVPDSAGSHRKNRTRKRKAKK